MGDTYTHGHQPSVLRSHTWRTAENSAAHLLPHLAPGQRLVDVGCGPGTITLDLAERVGHVLGLDQADEVLEGARAAAAERGIENVTFETGDVYALGLDDDSVDVVHAHQVLQHLTDPVAALTEVRRVLHPRGLLAVRDSDYSAFAWWPRLPELDRWMSLYQAVTAQIGAEADAGRCLLSWVRAAGFTDPVVSSSTWTFATPDDRAWWGGMWAERCTTSSLAHQAVDYGLASADDLAALAAGWHAWAADPDATFIVVHGEVLARA
jgi:SAM-dependent methyltransferase